MLATRKAIACAVLAACGESLPDEVPPPEPEDALVGTWFVKTPDKYDCVLGLVLGEDRQYQLDTVCTLAAGGYGIQVQLGTWDVKDGDHLSLFPERSTCIEDKWVPRGEDFKLSESGNQLRFNDGERLAVFERVPEGEGTGGFVAYFGCFDEDRVFTPGRVMEL